MDDLPENVARVCEPPGRLRGRGRGFELEIVELPLLIERTLTACLG
jgi:hypothetical protein